MPSPGSLQSDPMQQLMGGYHGSAGSGGEYIPQSVSASPPFHCPSTNLLSTSPSTTVLGGIGLGSTMQSMRDYFIAGGGGGNRPRTLSGEKGGCYATNSCYRPPSDVTHQSQANAGAADMLSLSVLPASPFDTVFTQTHQGGSDERSVNTGTITEHEKGNADTDEMFEFEDTEAADEDEEDEGGEEMPFAWAQQSAADSYVFSKAGISHVPDVSSDGTVGAGSRSGSAGGSSSMVNLNQSFIAQQCMAPPMLTSFRQTSHEERSSRYSQDMVRVVSSVYYEMSLDWLCRAASIVWGCFM